MCFVAVCTSNSQIINLLYNLAKISLKCTTEEMLKLWSSLRVNILRKLSEVYLMFFFFPLHPSSAGHQQKLNSKFFQASLRKLMLKTCWTNEGRRLVSLLSALCDLHRMNWGWRPRVTSSGASIATGSHSEHLPPLLQQHIHSGLRSLPSFLFSDLWPNSVSLQSLPLFTPCSSSTIRIDFFFSFFPPDCDLWPKGFPGHSEPLSSSQLPVSPT